MILADENIAGPVVDRLRADGVDVLWVTEVAAASRDEDVLDLASREGRILLTDDKDFGELVVRHGRAHAGVVLLRLAGMPLARRAELVSSFLRSSLAEIRGAFVVVDHDGRVRIRRPGTPGAPGAKA